VTGWFHVVFVCDVIRSSVLRGASCLFGLRLTTSCTDGSDHAWCLQIEVKQTGMSLSVGLLVGFSVLLLP